MICWLSNCLRERSYQLFRSLSHHFGLAYREISDLSTVTSKDVIFVNHSHMVMKEWVEQRAYLESQGWLKNTVLIGLDDIPPLSLLPHKPVFDGVWLLEWTGAGVGSFYDGETEWHFKPRGFPGVGFVKPIPQLPLKPFSERRNMFYFRGEPGHTPLRRQMLDRFSGCISFDFLHHTEYMQEMGEYKFALCPTGYGHTWRVVESMGMGCVPIVNDCNFLRFVHRFFVEGQNYLSVGPRLEKVDQVLNEVKDLRRMEKIAAAARTTFEQYFDVRDDVLPLQTILPVVRVLGRLFPNLICL